VKNVVRRSLPPTRVQHVLSRCIAHHTHQDFGQMRLMPVWCIPLHLALSLAAAVAVHHYVEEPLRKLLRPRARVGASSRCAPPLPVPFPSANPG
jgi:peptidoglycan/LPS O-acetylase OafA/YrhL